MLSLDDNDMGGNGARWLQTIQHPTPPYPFYYPTPTVPPPHHSIISPPDHSPPAACVLIHTASWANLGTRTQMWRASTIRCQRRPLGPLESELGASLMKGQSPMPGLHFTHPSIRPPVHPLIHPSRQRTTPPPHQRA